MGLLKAQLKSKTQVLSTSASTAIAKAVAKMLVPSAVPQNPLEQELASMANQENLNVLMFYYTKDYIINEAHKRTSYIGRVRRNEEKVSLMEQVTLTADDEELANSFLMEAQGYVFEKLQNYTHGLDDCCLFDKISFTENGVDKEVEAYIFKINHMEWFNNNALQMLDTSIGETMIAFLMFKWFLGALPSEAQFYYEEFERQLKNITQRVNTQKQPVRRKYHLF